MAEKRVQHRHKKRIKVRFGQDVSKKIAFTADLSQEGVFVSTGKPEPPGTYVQLELNLSPQDTIRAVGQVRWAKKVPPHLFHVAKKAGMGVQIKSFKQGRVVFLDYLKALKS